VANLNDASADVMSSVRSPTQLAASSRTFGTAFGDLLRVSTEMAGQTKVSICSCEAMILVCLWRATVNISTVHVVGQEGSGADDCVIEECFHGILQVAGDRKIGSSRPISTQC